MYNMLIDDTRGQSFTFEAITAILLILAAMIFVLQGSAITPLSADTENINQQQSEKASDVLDIAHEDGLLKETLLYYDTQNDRFVGSDRGDGSYSYPPPSDFGDLLADNFDRNNILYEIDIVYENTEGETETKQMVNRGERSASATTVTKQVILYDDDIITDPANNDELQDDLGFYAPNIDENRQVYNVVEVQMTIWE